MTGEWILSNSRYKHYRFDNSIKEEIQSLKPDNWHGPLALLEDYAIIFLCIASCYYFSWWLYPIAVIVIGARQRGLSTILHDAAHGVCARNRRLNMFLGTLATAYPIFQRHYAYKQSHVQTHHPLLGDPVRDPDLSFFIEQGVYTPTSRDRYFIKMVILPVLGSRTLAYLKYLINNRYKHILSKKKPLSKTDHVRQNSEQRKDNFAFFLFWIAIIIICFYFGVLMELFLFWIVPYLSSFHILGWFIEVSEHSPLVQTQNVDLYMSRNRKSRGLEKFLTGIHNDHHHLDHHLDPRTPFYHLPKAHEIRMRDPNYARIDEQTGGLFTRGPNGSPSAIGVLLDAMRRKTEFEKTADRANAA